MRTVRVRNVEIGEGVPKICVPIIGKTEEEIVSSASKIMEHDVDLVEWRADWFEGLMDRNRVGAVLEQLRKILKETPILFTIRTAAEGGEITISKEQYSEINQYAAETGYVDLIDVEVFLEGADTEKLAVDLKERDVAVIGSNHEFYHTPEKDEIVRRLCLMQEKGMDILKIAVMPQKEADVITLLSATEEMTSQYADRPVVTMSMGQMGVISRVAGSLTGSTVTFGAIGKTSAPGQLEVNQLRQILTSLSGTTENMQITK